MGFTRPTVWLLCLLCGQIRRNGMGIVAAWSNHHHFSSTKIVGSRNTLQHRPSSFLRQSSRTSQETLQSDKAPSEEDNVNAYFDTSPTRGLVAPKGKSSFLDDIISTLPGNNNSLEYQKGLITIGFITLVFASNSPVLHAAFSQGTTASNAMNPPVLLLNAAVSAVALVGLLMGGETLEQNTELPSSLVEQQQQQQGKSDAAVKQQDETLALQGGCELGLWKFLGTTANIYGLSLTTAAHGAFLIQLTTLIVPVVQRLMGVPIPRRIQFSVVLALAGVVCFTQDPTGTPSMVGDILCVIAAGFYATYDLRLYEWGKQVAPRRLITGKIATQALLSLGLLLTAGSTSAILSSSATSISELSAWDETMQYLSSNPDWSVLIPVVLWSGVCVNALAPFLQVGGQQAVGPTRCQTIYASQPLWAAIMSFVVFGETIGWQGLVGGSAFLTALYLAATAEAPGAGQEEDQSPLSDVQCE